MTADFPVIHVKVSPGSLTEGDGWAFETRVELAEFVPQPELRALKHD